MYVYVEWVISHCPLQNCNLKLQHAHHTLSTSRRVTSLIQGSHPCLQNLTCVTVRNEDIIKLMSTVGGLCLWMLTVTFSSPPRRRTVLGTGPSPDTGCPSKWSRAGPGSLFHHQHLAVGLLRGLYRVAGSFACFYHLIFLFFWVSSDHKMILALILNKCLKSLKSPLLSFFVFFFTSA